MMNKILNLTARPSRFLKPGRSLLLLMLLVFCTTAFATPTTPTSDFIDNNDGTVTHKLTGLVWMRCSVGQTWDKATANCTGTATTYTWDAAMALKSNFAGKSDWRLPNIAELHTIMELENLELILNNIFSAVAINKTIFPKSPLMLWSSFPNAGNSNYAWIGNFFEGYAEPSTKNDSYAVLLVRGGSFLGSLTTPTAAFVDNKDGTVTHTLTGLTWQRCSTGQIWTGSTCSETANTYTYDQAIALKSSFAGKNDWRVPSLHELSSIIEYGSYNPAINNFIFPNIPRYSNTWTSFSVDNSSQYVLALNFANGYISSDDKNSGNFVRFVRGQWANVIPNSSNLPDGTIAGDAKGWVNLLSFGNTLGNYMGVTAYINNSDSSGIYQSSELAFRFAKNVLHLTKPVKPDGKKLAAANKDKAGYVVMNGTRTNIIAKYYPKGSTTPPVNGSIISQTSTVAAGHVSIAKKVVKIDEKNLDIYLFEQNWIFGYSIADSRKMRFTKDATGAWTGKTTLNNKAVGWLNPEVK